MVNPVELPRPVAERTVAGTLFSSLRNLQRSSWRPEFVAGVTLLAIAIPEQVATAQLAEVPAFFALLAFMVATIVFASIGSNPIISIGADSTIAPLFAVALVRLAAPQSSHYLELVAGTAVVTGFVVFVIGAFRLGWLADFLSAPIVAGFMTGIGLTIMVHQLPHALGITAEGGTFISRIGSIAQNLSSANGWCLAISLGTLGAVLVGERVNPRLPFALGAIVIATVATYALDLAARGVATVGTVVIHSPTWRLTNLSWHDCAVMATTGATVAIVVLSQSAATSREVADELGVDIDVNRDFVAIGLANVASGLAGAIPVNASPARTKVVRDGGGRTQLVGLVAALGVLLVIPLAPAMKYMPLAALAGVLFYVAGRLIKVTELRQIARVDRYELALAIVTGLAVIFIGVQEGLAVAVLLAIIDQTRRSTRPRVVVLGRRPDTTSWEPMGHEGAAAVDDVAVLLFAAPLFFANSALFRSEVHSTMRTYPDSRHLVIDAAAITDIDFTGLHALATIVADLQREHVDVVLARANERVVHSLIVAPSRDLNLLPVFATVDMAVRSFED